MLLRWGGVVSNFAFLRAEWPELFGEAIRAERLAVADPRTSCFYARRAVELALNWLYEADSSLHEPYRRDLSAMINEPTLVNLAGPALRTKMDVIRRQGNLAVHSGKPVRNNDATRTAAELFHVLYWLARNYARNEANVPAAGLGFDASLIPVPEPAEVRQKKQAELQEMARQFAEQQAELATERSRSQDLDTEVQRLREQIKAAKAVNARRQDPHDYNEAETRVHIIDLLLQEAGWSLDEKQDREYPVLGLPTKSGKGKVDYVLWDDDGKPLGLVEAKATTHSALEGQEQARQYAEALQSTFGQRPVIFYTNGYETWLWDDGNRYPPRPVQGFYTKDELRSLITRRASPAGAEQHADQRGDRRTVLPEPRHPPNRGDASSGRTSARPCWSWRPVRARRGPLSPWSTCCRRQAGSSGCCSSRTVGNSSRRRPPPSKSICLAPPRSTC